MPVVFIGIGSNLGDRGSFFRCAAREIPQETGACDLKCSPVYETEPVDGAGPPLYWNAVWSFTTALEPQVLLEKLHGIEAHAGRRRKVPCEARVLDLDILFYGDRVIKQTALTIPHPRIPERAFVLVPFCDLAPEFVHPELRQSMRQLLGAYRERQGGVPGVRRLPERETWHR